MSQALTQDMILFNTPVVQSEDRQRHCSGICLKLGLGAIEVVLPTPPAGRYSWLEFTLPETNYRIKVLAECTNVVQSENGHRVLFRYKHMFPRDRTALATLFATTQAA
jgi:hypothetical protein